MFQWKTGVNGPVHSEQNKSCKFYTTCIIGIADSLMPSWRCMDHSVILKYSIGLSGTDDPCISKIFVFPKFTWWGFDQRENGFWLNDSQMYKMNILTLLGGYWSVK